MEINALVEAPEEVWVSFQDAEVLLVYQPLEDLKALMKNHTSATYFTGGKKKEKVDYTALALELGERAVKDWKGVTLKGQPFFFSPENRDMLITKWSEFSSFVMEASTDIAVFAQDKREEDEKNSSST